MAAGDCAWGGLRETADSRGSLSPAALAPFLPFYSVTVTLGFEGDGRPPTYHLEVRVGRT